MTQRWGENTNQSSISIDIDTSIITYLNIHMSFVLVLQLHRTMMDGEKQRKLMPMLQSSDS
jgi:hypothetical protein